MTDNEQIIIYDTMVSMQKHAPALVELLNARSTPGQRDAYKSGVYAAVTRLGSLFTSEQHEAHKARLQKIKEDADAFFAKNPDS